MPTPVPDRYRDGCTLAKLALVIHQIAPDQLPAYHEWAFGDGWPRTAAQARAYVESRVDPALLEQALADPALDAVLRRNADAWAAARDERLVAGLPIHLTPAGGLLPGRVRSADELRALLRVEP
jgi:hypothetical protein